MSKKVMLLGNGGHAKVIADMIARTDEFTLAGFLDSNIETYSLNNDLIFDNMDNIHLYSDCKFVIAIGNNKVRKIIIEKYNLDETQFVSVIATSAYVASNAKIGIGTVVMPNAIINEDAVIGNHAIINSGAIIEHDNIIEDFVHISPGATLSGTVHVEAFTHIGTNATVIPNINIGKQCTIGAGSVVIKDIPDNVVAVGNPTRIIKTIN
ncbi:acetyltransferase [Macrococcus capreoli]|uniref:acetyltransferase n=1 Tax=Macrococcus capreoli TaxID=2982690 RepID=UPI003F4394E6